MDFWESIRLFTQGDSTKRNEGEMKRMALFDSIISEASERFGLGNKAGGLLASLLSLMTDQNQGGFDGFLNLFKSAGLSDSVSGWISSGDSDEISREQVVSALGENTISQIADQHDLSTEETTSALGYMIPAVVDRLTPDGTVPAEKDLLSKIGGFLSGIGGAVAGAAIGTAGVVGAVASGTADKVGDAAGATIDAGKAVVGGAADMVGDEAGATVDAGKKVAGAVGDSVGGAFTSVGNAVGDVTDGGGSMLKWLIPLILLLLLLALGWMFCRPATPTPTATGNTNTNANANKANVNTNVNANTTPSVAANTSGAERKLTDVTLPNGTKLEAYPGGIEDQLIKFIQSDKYKNATNEDLKKPENWFSFDDLNFVKNKTELVPASKRQLDNITAILKAFPDVKIKIGGYTDKSGNDAINKKLSDDRAKAVQAKLKDAGVGAQVPEAEGYGSEQAKVPATASDEERAVDRKTAIRLIKGETTKSAESNANTAKPASANTANANH